MKILINGKETNMTREELRAEIRANNLVIVGISEDRTAINVRGMTPEERARREEINRRVQILRRRKELEEWFIWYDQQVNQYNRAQRLGKNWSAEKDGKHYTTLEDMDGDADSKHAELTNLQASDNCKNNCGKENHKPPSSPQNNQVIQMQIEALQSELNSINEMMKAYAQGGYSEKEFIQLQQAQLNILNQIQQLQQQLNG